MMAEALCALTAVNATVGYVAIAKTYVYSIPLKLTN